MADDNNTSGVTDTSGTAGASTSGTTNSGVTNSGVTNSGVTDASTSTTGTTSGGLSVASSGAPTVTAPATTGTTATPALNARLLQLASCIASDINALIAAENTAHGVLQSNIDAVQANIEAVDAEVKALIADSKTSGSANTWSIDQINKAIAGQITAALGGLTQQAIATIQQVAAELANEESAVSAILTQLSKAVRVDMAQAFSDTEKAQARGNIGALSIVEVNTAISEAFAAEAVVFADVDLCAAYAAARAGH